MGGRELGEQKQPDPLSSWVILYTGSCATFLHATDIKCASPSVSSHSCQPGNPGTLILITATPGHHNFTHDGSQMSPPHRSETQSLAEEAQVLRLCLLL